MGETPNLAARLQNLATPNTVVLSVATYRLIEGYFACQPLGAQTLKGVPQPLEVYKVLGESGAQSRFEAAASRGLTPLIGREHEVGLLLERWERAKQAEGQVMLLSGEPGIGKSRLVQVMREQSAEEGALRLEFRCSPYHQNSAFYPVIEHLQRVLQFERDDTPQTKLAKLERTLAGYRFPQQDTPPLLAALLSLPHPDSYPPLNLSPQRQKQKTQEALVAWLLEETEKSAVYNPWEDVHWADPSSLELLHTLIDQAPTARLYILLTFRPEFTPPWGTRSHISQLTLSRLGRHQVTQMIEKVSAGKTLPGEIMQQIVAKTDGVPLFVEELTKAVLEQDVGAHSSLPLAIPATLHDSLMARLDRLNTAKEIAQLGATLGREFSYELIQAVSPLGAEALQKGLTRLVEAELIYQRGLPPQARYVFKHALVQDAAYQSLLKSRRQQLHQQIAQVLEERFPETKETQPELLAHHYTEAGLVERASSYWQKAGEQATQRSANLEAINHLTKGLELLNTLPDTPARAHQEISLQIILGSALMASKGYAAPEVERAYTRAHELCQQVRETLQLFPVLWGLWAFYVVRAAHQTARQWGEEYLSLTQRQQNPTFLLGAHRVLGESLAWLGELDSAQAHLQQGVALASPERLQSHAFLFGQSPELDCLSRVAHVQWRLGYPDRALAQCREVLPMANQLSHPLSLASTLGWVTMTHQLCRDVQGTQALAETTISLCTEQGFPFWLAMCTILRGWALTEQGETEEGITQLRQGLAAWQATGAEIVRPYWLALLAEAYGKVGQAEEGLSLMAEGLALVDKTEEHSHEAELYRLKGQLTLQKFQVSSSKFQVTNPQAEAEAEAYFQKAIEIARQQQAKSWELRAATSLARLWQEQGKKEEALQMLAEIYGWFTEGFDTVDLQEAKALLRELA